MNSKKDRVTFRNRLMNWYAHHKRTLPWRKTNNPYHIWVSEIMLQQTQVKTVIPYYHRFIERFPDMPTLAKTDLEQVLKLWEGLGYYSRARNFHYACNQIMETHNGRFPGSIDGFLTLKGVGEYTAAAVFSIAFNYPKAVVDGNVKRVLSRLYTLEYPVNKPSSHKAFSTFAEQLLERKESGTFNQAMMELGALICKPSGPLCEECPVSFFCSAFNENVTDQYPKRIKNKKVPEYDIAVAVVIKKGRLLITKRKEEGLLGGL